MILSISTVVFGNETCSTDVGAETTQEQLEIKTDVPSHLKGATIIIRTADSKESSVPAEKFKVVPRKQQFIVTKTKQESKTTCSVETIKPNRKNRVSLLAGNGPAEGLDRTVTPDKVTIESRTGAMVGAQLQHLFTERVSGAVQLQTNQTGAIGIGYDF